MADPSTPFTDLIIVCCHAIYIGSNADPWDPIHWLLQPFQKGNASRPAENGTFIQHLQLGLDFMYHSSSTSRNSNPLLILSGGPTKPSLTDLSEAQSYYNVLLDLSTRSPFYSHLAQSLFSSRRLLLEEHATDSYQNLLFSILRFHEATGTYPHSIRVITHAFKSPRFLKCHAPATRWPADRITTSGLDPPMTAADHAATLQGEASNGMGEWSGDHHGRCATLHAKRLARGYPSRRPPYVDARGGLETPVKEMLWYSHGTDGETKLSMKLSGPLPWEGWPPITEAQGMEAPHSFRDGDGIVKAERGGS